MEESWVMGRKSRVPYDKEWADFFTDAHPERFELH